MKKIFFVLAILTFLTAAVVSLSQRKKSRALLVVGCARSGTTYISKVLKQSGLKIGHEKMKDDGLSSWDLAVNHKEGRWKIRPEDYHFEHIFHQVRDPLKVISSVYFTEDLESWYYIMKHIPEIYVQDSHLVKCAKYWYYWNLAAEKIAEWTYRIEDLDGRWDEFGQRLGKKIVRDALEEMPKDVNTRNYSHRRQFTWEDLKRELDPEFYQKIRQLAEKYHY